MHEVADDQRGFHKRQAQQNGQHLHGLHILIGQIDFDSGHCQERAPYPEERRFAVMAMLFRNAFRESLLNGIHIPPAPRESWRTSDKPGEKGTPTRGPRSANTGRQLPRRTSRILWASATG